MGPLHYNRAELNTYIQPIKLKYMKQLFRNNFIEVSLVKALVVGIAKADDNYALLLGFIIIEFKPYGIFRKAKNSPNTF